MKIEDMKGMTMTSVENINDEKLRFTSSEGRIFELYHDQDCCEQVTIEDICGNLSDLVGSPLLVSEETSCNPPPSDPYQDSETWTFYRFGTTKGFVTVRWYGTSNGYYSERVDFKEVVKENL